MGLIVSIVLGLIFYWEGRRLYKETENIRNYKELQSR